MSLSRADVKCLTLNRYGDERDGLRRNKRSVESNSRDGLVWPGSLLFSLSSSSSLYASHFSAFAYKKMLLFQRTLFFFSLLLFYPFSFSFSFSFSNDALWHGRITCYQVIMVDESESLHRRIEGLSWKKGRWNVSFPSNSLTRFLL